jgi:hypothetical protein
VLVDGTVLQANASKKRSRRIKALKQFEKGRWRTGKPWPSREWLPRVKALVRAGKGPLAVLCG